MEATKKAEGETENKTIDQLKIEMADCLRSMVKDQRLVSEIQARIAERSQRLDAIEAEISRREESAAE